MTVIDDILGEDGLFSKRLPNYEFRPEQIEVSNAIFQAMMDNQHIVVEAGTGVGKSFGYLIPAILSLNESDKPIIISTNTINLQEQLIKKDLPFLKENLGLPLNFVLAKGRSNFVSIRRLNIAMEKRGSLFDSIEEVDELRSITNWAAKTEDGSKTDLEFNPTSKIWQEVQSEKDNCLGRKCPHYRECFFYKARQELKNADIIVVNHALLFADLQLRASGQPFLPDYKRLVIDEAHKIESVAGEQLGFSVSRAQVLYLLSKIYNPKKNKGYFANHDLKSTIVDVLENAIYSINEFFDNVLMYLNDHTDYKTNILRLREANIIDTSPLLNMQRLIDKLNDALVLAQNDNDQVQIESFIQKLADAIHTITSILFQDNGDEYAYWLERPGKSDTRISLNAAPINVSEYLERELFKKVQSVTMTSATIAIGKKEKDFEYFNKRVGLKNGQELLVGSPFNYRSQVKLYLPQNIEQPKEQNFSLHTIEAIKHYVEMTQGGCLILFTSYSAMDQAFLALQYQFKQNGYQVLVQGKDLSRSQMIQEFKKDLHSVLFGTDSFWEGVDVPGECLRNIIITKLPFSVPTHPLTQAKYEYIAKQGKSPFKELALPEALIKFKQGFGRLIRSKRDKGIVCILDSRILNKPYGRKFMQSIPDCEVIYENLPFQSESKEQ